MRSPAVIGQSWLHFRQHHFMKTAPPSMVVSGVMKPVAPQKGHFAGNRN